MSQNLRVYTASCICHAPKWRSLRTNSNQSNVTWTARWPQLVERYTETQTDAFWTLIWDIDSDDIDGSDIVWLHAEPSDELRGAIFEAGMGLLSTRYGVLLSGENKGFSTWQHHRRVHKVPTFLSALQWLSLAMEDVSPQAVSGLPLLRPIV